MEIPEHERLLQQSGYTPAEVAGMMLRARQLGFDDEWTLEQATAFFNKAGMMLARAEEQPLSGEES